MNFKVLTLVFALLLPDPIGNLGRVAKRNEMKAEAEKAYKEGDYKLASEKYSYLIDSLNMPEESMIMNLANAQYKLSDSAKALSNYQKLTSSKNKSLRSQALNQLGVLNNKPQNRQTALDYFKNALRSDPTNEDARYNYELLKKLMEEEKDQNQDDQDKKDKEEQEKENQQDKQEDKQQQDQEEKNQEKGEEEHQQQQDQQEQEQQEGNENEDQQESADQQEGEESEEEPEEQQGEQESEEESEENESKEMPPSTKQKLEEMKISPEKAKMILEAMKNQEIHYIQQNRKKPTSRTSDNKPDW